MTPPLPFPFVDAGWLLDHGDGVVIVDSRWYLDGRSGRAAYDAGHIDGAVFCDLDHDLSAPAGAGGRHPLPDPEHFATAMGRLGIGDRTPVVVYDDAGGVIAGRLWWMLDALDHPAAILDGGISAWPEPLATTTPTITPARFTPRAWPADRFATADEVATRAGDVVLLDARSLDRFSGRENAIDPRFGHIPGARSAPATDVLAGGAVADPDTLRAHFADRGVDEDTAVIAYCGSGVSACIDLAALAAVGNRRTRLYVGSWSEWGADPARPLEAGEGADG